ncbi:MAG: type II toxin-antitoxin system prevent-host-death family antitoxin [Candidatus Latescibacteria bacterium]|nr:type II toxin-antitoxin system prevent-host-death family antitoxin [Candidatus Latescibacterota bacterium]
MKAITYDYAKQHLRSVMDQVADYMEPIRIEQEKGKSAILVNAEDFDSLMETAYLLRSPANAARLKQALDEFESGKGILLDAQAIMDNEKCHAPPSHIPSDALCPPRPRLPGGRRTHDSGW